MRRPSVGRLIGGLLVATIVCLIAIDTTAACRFFLRHRHYAPCTPVVACPPVHCVVVESSCCETVVESDCCGGVEVTESAIEPAPMPEMAEQPDAEADVEPATVDMPVEPEPIVDEPVVDEPEIETLPEDEPPAFDDLDTPVEEPADDAFDLPGDDLPADDLPGVEDFPADEMPADDLDVFDTPADDTIDELPAVEDTPDDADADLFELPADDAAPADDLFDAPADDAPADDLFDAPADDAPADDLFDAPVDDAPADDLFDAPPASDDVLPGTDDALPADDAPADDAGDSLDDLFGTGPPSDTSEARTAQQPAADDLFDLPADDSAAPAEDDLFDAPAADEPADEAPVDDLDDLFGAQSTPSEVKPVAKQADELPFRLWTDNTGRYKTVGRLVKISPTHVRLLKDNGRFSTVSKLRLSPADLAYVSEMVTQLGVEPLDQVARR